MKVLRLLLSDPDYYVDTASDAMTEVINPWAEWINEIAPHFTPEPTDFGFCDGWNHRGHDLGRFTFWDIEWDGEECRVMVQDSKTGDEVWWTPPTPAPAHLMKHAKFVDKAGGAA